MKSRVPTMASVRVQSKPQEVTSAADATKSQRVLRWLERHPAIGFAHESAPIRRQGSQVLLWAAPGAAATYRGEGSGERSKRGRKTNHQERGLRRPWMPQVGAQAGGCLQDPRGPRGVGGSLGPLRPDTGSVKVPLATLGRAAVCLK